MPLIELLSRTPISASSKFARHSYDFGVGNWWSVVPFARKVSAVLGE